MEFKYKAVNKDGKILSGILDAETENKAIELLKKKKLDIISIKQLKKFFTFKKKIKSQELILFTRVLSQLIKSGVPIIKSLDIIKSTIGNKYLKNIINKISFSISHGTSFSSALKKHPDIFNDFYCAGVEAGENTGQLGEVLNHIYNYLYNAGELKKNIISALIYPFIIIITAFFVLFGIILFLVPQFKLLFNQFYTKLPIITRIVLYMNTFLEQNILLILFIILSALFSIIIYFHTNKGKLLRDRLLLHIPVISGFVKETIYAKISRIMGVLFDNDVDILKTLTIVSGLITNQIFKKKLRVVSNNIKSGIKVSEAFSNANIFPDIIIQMSRIGEETGSFSEMFLTAAKYYEESLKMKSKLLLSILQPLLIIFTGIIIMFILIAIFIPIFQLSDLIK